MPVIGGTRVLIESLDAMYAKLRETTGRLAAAP
jgi:hypothetical protein